MFKQLFPAIFIFGSVVSTPFVVSAADPALPKKPAPSFHMVKPPPPGTKKFINIQVEPSSPPPPQIAPATPTPAEPGQGAGGVKTQKPLPLPGTAPTAQMAWFWDAISPSLTAGAPGRFETALETLAAAPLNAVPAPSLQSLQQVAQLYGRSIMGATVGKRISPALVLALISVESSGAFQATSQKGAIGLMQLMPATAKRFNVADPMDPAENIRGGVAYLDALLSQFSQDPILALAAYNAGENAILDNVGVPPFDETRAFVPRVVAAFQVAKALCKTPPELYSDGCVFAVKGP